MMVANSFDLWQKDSFFSAAEEVQDSADIMESVYRTWMRQRREGVEVEDLGELRRELQTVLGTAKWQLEEFERAVRLSHGCRPEDAATARHYQFVAAIEDQINRVEVALRDSISEQGNQPLRWVQLDEEERDDLAAFLSGTTAASSQLPKDPTFRRGSPSNNSSSSMGSQIGRKDVRIDVDSASPRQSNNLMDVVTIPKDSICVVELESKESPVTVDDASYQTERLNGQRRTWSTPNFGTWKIVIADEDKNNDALEASVESTPKAKGFKTGFWKQKAGEHLQSKGGMPTYLDLRGFNKLTQLVGQLPRQVQSLQHLQFSRSLRIVLFIMLAVFLIVPFMLYSN